MDLIKLLDLANPKKVKDTINSLLTEYSSFTEQNTTATNLAINTANDALDVANATTAVASTALDNSTIALADAQTAVDTSVSAKETSDEAYTFATDAFTNSEDAVQYADQAFDNANEAMRIAEAADALAIQAQQESSNALNISNTANATAANALSIANTANTNSSNAVSTANTALATAASANTKSETAVTTANTASTTATNAVTTANSANTKADNAVSTANNANNKSDNAVLTANNALELINAAYASSEEAVNTANSAKAVAEGIDAKATQALATAGTATNTASEAKELAQSAIDQVVGSLGTKITTNGVVQTTWETTTKADKTELEGYLPLSAGSTKRLTNDLFFDNDMTRGIYFKSSTTQGDCCIEAYENNSLNLMGTSAIYIRNDYGGDYVSIENNKLYQNGKEVANKEDVSTNYIPKSGGTLNSGLQLGSTAANAFVLPANGKFKAKNTSGTTYEVFRVLSGVADFGASNLQTRFYSKGRPVIYDYSVSSPTAEQIALKKEIPDTSTLADKAEVTLLNDRISALENSNNTPQWETLLDLQEIYLSVNYDSTRDQASVNSLNNVLSYEEAFEIMRKASTKSLIKVRAEFASESFVDPIIISGIASIDYGNITGDVAQAHLIVPLGGDNNNYYYDNGSTGAKYISVNPSALVFSTGRGMSDYMYLDIYGSLNGYQMVSLKSFKIEAIDSVGGTGGGAGATIKTKSFGMNTQEEAITFYNWALDKCTNASILAVDISAETYVGKSLTTNGLKFSASTGVTSLDSYTKMYHSIYATDPQRYSCSVYWEEGYPSIMLYGGAFNTWEYYYSIGSTGYINYTGKCSTYSSVYIGSTYGYGFTALNGVDTPVTFTVYYIE